MLASSTVITPSLPTRSNASAMSSPTALSCADTDATAAMSFLPSTSRALSSRAAETASTALSMPRLRPIGLAPEATLRRPSRTMAWASTVAVVVPSPAMSLVLVATSLASWAPRFSKESSSSTSRAIVTPSLVIVGAPHFLSITTLRPRGPRVTLTASASLLTPRSSALRAESSNCRVLAIGLTSSPGSRGLREMTTPRRTGRGGTARPGRSRGGRGRLRRSRPRVGQGRYLSRTASTSRADRTRYSSPLCLTSVPPYLL